VPSGARRRFEAGAVLSLAALPIHGLCNEQSETVLLSALSRRSTATPARDASGG
jgi:hypothetical protein